MTQRLRKSILISWRLATFRTVEGKKYFGDLGYRTSARHSAVLPKRLQAHLRPPPESNSLHSPGSQGLCLVYVYARGKIALMISEAEKRNCTLRRRHGSPSERHPLLKRTLLRRVQTFCGRDALVCHHSPRKSLSRPLLSLAVLLDTGQVERKKRTHAA